MSQIERKSLLNTYLINDWYIKYTKNSWNPTIKTTIQLKSGQKTCIDASPKKIYRWKISIWKDNPYHMSSVTYKLKWQDNCYRCSKILKSKTLRTVNASENVEQLELYLMLVEMKNGTATFENLAIYV